VSPVSDLAHEERERLAREVAAGVATLGEEATHFFPLPGGVVTIVDRRGVLAQVTFGYADAERSLAMPATGRFQIGSISKVFTSLAVTQLIDDGGLRFEDTLGETLAWPRFGPELATITVRELLNHTSGLPAGADALADDAAEIWNMRDREPEITGRGHFHYSNIGYQLLGEIVRERTGRRVNDLVLEKWLRPLGMVSATAEVTYEDRAALVPGSWPLAPNHPWAPGDALAPATFLETDSASGNVVASSDDVARLMMALIGASDGSPLLDTEGHVVLSPAVFERMTTLLALEGEPTVVLRGMTEVNESRYGLGINVERVDGHRCVSHGGGMIGYSTFMLVDCSSGFGVTVFTNANGETLASQLLARAAHAQFVRALEGQEPLDTLTMDATVRSGNAALGSDGVGSFVSDRDASVLEIVDPGEGRAMVLRRHGGEGQLFRRPMGRFVTDHSAMRDWCLDLGGTGAATHWIYGHETFHPSASSPPPSAGTDRANPLLGHYRSYSPWFPEFRIIERGGSLFLSAPGGVEAPSDDEELIEVAEGVMRVGADPSAPERLFVGPRRHGEVLSVNRDGCWYSRVFSP
jgi:D-alanyl-D-alanine carboxypeptidase